MTDKSSIISLRRKLEKEAWELKFLSEIATEIISGEEITKEHIGTGDYPAIRYSDVFHNPVFIKECNSFLNPELIRRPKFCEYGDILVAVTSNVVDNIGKAVVYLGNEKPMIGKRIELLKHDENGKFLSYMLNTKFVKDQIKKLTHVGTVINMNKSCFSKIKIPLPPRHIQDQIVEYLDKWTSLESQLEQELEQELEQRKKQYEYYKESLLNSGMNKWEIISMDKIATEIMIGREVAKNQLGTGDYPAIKCGDINSKFIHSFTNCVGFINLDLIKSRVFCEYGDVLMSFLGSEDVIGKSVVYLGKDRPVLGEKIALIRHNQNGRFLSYILSSEFVRKQIVLISKGGVVIYMNKSWLRKIKVPLPSIEEQAQIVEVLDKFHTITESFKDGLPSLIEKHKKQYIYYKEQILNPEITL